MANRYFTCKTNQNPISYRCGEEIVFHIYYRFEGVTVPAVKFQWHMEADFGFEDEGICDGQTGELVLKAKLDKPGFVYVTAKALDENGDPAPESDIFYGGAGVEIEKITAVTEEPEGYHEFWNICKKELYCMEPKLLESKKLPADPLHPNHDVYDVRIACVGSIPVSGILTIPRDGKKHPARVTCQGYGVKSAWHLFGDDVINLCINAHGIHNDEPQSYYDNLASGKLANYGFDEEQNRNPHTCYFKYMMIRAAQALRFVMTLPEWDGKTLISRGGSQGAVQAIQGASMVDEVTLIDTWVPWLCDISSGDIGRICGFGNFSGNAMRFFDLSLRAKYVTKKVIISAGLGDATTRASGITAMYHKLAGEKTLSFTQSREHIYVSPEAESFPFEG